MRDQPARSFLGTMGDPPNVAGWDGGRHWINTTTLLARYNFSLFLLDGRPMAAIRRHR